MAAIAQNFSQASGIQIVFELFKPARSFAAPAWPSPCSSQLTAWI
jgi:hypothetical protein